MNLLFPPLLHRRERLVEIITDLQARFDVLYNDLYGPKIGAISQRLGVVIAQYVCRRSPRVPGALASFGDQRGLRLVRLRLDGIMSQVSIHDQKTVETYHLDIAELECSKDVHFLVLSEMVDSSSSR